LAAVWDTTLASQIKVGSPAYEYCVEHFATPDPVLIAAGAVFETAFGYQMAAPRRPEFETLLDQFVQDVVGETICHVLPMDGMAAFIAGQVLARKPLPPNPNDRQRKAVRRRSWVGDVQIGATCWAAGHDVATDNQRDFDHVARAIADLYPDARPLTVTARPF
jgi:hypothetical protein